MLSTGRAGEPPTPAGQYLVDAITASTAFEAVIAALLHRERTGEATKVDVALFDCQLALLENAVMRYTTTGEIPGPMGARKRLHGPCFSQFLPLILGVPVRRLWK